MRSMLNIDNVSFSYGYWRVLTSCTCKIASGEIVHVTGANGVGKTTLLHLVAGLMQPTDGFIRLLDDNAQREIAPRAPHIELLAAEHNGLFGTLDPLSNLTFWGTLKGQKTSRDALVELLGAWGFAGPALYEGFAVRRLSTGMKRRLALARVVLSGAPVWLLDEPCNGMDEKGRAAFVGALTAHARQGGLAMVASHDGAIFGGLATRRLQL